MAPVDAERAVATHEQWIVIELVDTAVRDLFGVGLVLQEALLRARGPAEQPLARAVDDIDGVIGAIRGVVFDVFALLSDAACAPGESDGGPVETFPAVPPCD